jgi:hypothetical protein
VNCNRCSDLDILHNGLGAGDGDSPLLLDGDGNPDFTLNLDRLGDSDGLLHLRGELGNGSVHRMKFPIQ